MTGHLSHLYILVLCSSCTNSKCVSMRVPAALMSARGFSSFFRGQTRASFKDEAPLQLSAALCEKAQEAATNALDIRLSDCESKRLMRGNECVLMIISGPE